MDEFTIVLRNTFLEEFLESASRMETLFMVLEKNPADADCINEIFRLMHNTKGSSRAVGLDAMAKLAHAAENILSEIRSGKVQPSLAIVNALLQGLDAMKAGSETFQNGTEDTSIYDRAISNLLLAAQPGSSSHNEEPTSSSSLDHQASGNTFIDFSTEEEKTHPPVSGGSNFIDADTSMPSEVAPKKSDSADLSAPEPAQMIPFQNKASDPIANGAATAQASANSKAKTEESIRINLAKIEEIQNIFGEQIILQSALEHSLAQDPIDLHQSEKILAQLRKLSVSLQNLIIRLRMVPVSSVLGRLTRAVRDVATSTEKLVEIKLEGGDHEIDKNILEQLIDPLVHMVRNSVDHGVEMPEERKQKNKSPSGTIKISARRLGSNFEIKISDDGKGLSKEKILEKAHSSGIVPRGFVPENKDIFKLIFASGFSTKASATEFSGRGVGMDVVQQQVKSLKGSIDIDSIDGSGSTFTIKIPLSLAIFNGTVVKIGEEKYVIPNTDYRETISLDSNKNRRSSDQKGTIVEFNKELMRLVDLRDRLGSKLTKKADLRNIALVVEHENQKFACIVSDILYQEQIVLKEMGPETKLVKEATGGTILGDGKVALIIDLVKIIASKGIAA